MMKRSLLASFLLLSLVLSAWSFTNFNTTGQGDIVEIDTVPIASIVNINTIENPTGFYNNVIGYSAMFDSASGTTMSYTPGAAGTEETFTISTWIKRTNITVAQHIVNSGTAGTALVFNADDTLTFATASGTLTTTRLFRDCSAWYHFVVAVDTTQATAADRVNIYVNGSLITDFDTEDYPDQNEVTDFLKTNPHKLGDDHAGANHFVGLMAEFILVDGTQYAATDFGEFEQGIWRPKEVSGLTFGTYGTWLDFEDSADLGDDNSGNTNDWAETNFGTDHQYVDRPEANYATLDFNIRYDHSSAFIYEGGLSYRWATATWTSALATFPMHSGKWYWEINIGADTSFLMAGVVTASDDSKNFITANYAGKDGLSAAMNLNNTNYRFWVNNSATVEDNLDAPASGDIMTIAFDADTGKLWLGLYNAGSGHVWGDFGASGVGDPANDTNPVHTFSNPEKSDWVPIVSANAHSTMTINFGQFAFSGTKPSGFNALITSNLPEPTVIDPQDDYINVVTYVGDGSISNAITGVGFDPDFVWIKNRDATDIYQMFDSVRGATNYLDSVNNTAETEDTDTLLSFDADGFTVGEDVKVNTNTENYVAWCLKEQTGFFDIVTYTGTGSAHTEAHDLGVTPEFIIIKNLDQGDSWAVYSFAAYNKTDPETDYGGLNLASAWIDGDTFWNDTAPTSSVFTVGTDHRVNASGENYIAYLFASMSGVSRVFSYEGNAAATGPYVYPGLKPKWIFVKNADGATNWGNIDTARKTYNPIDALLYPNLINVEATTTMLDVFANGFKIRGTGGVYNTGAGTHVGIAFADQPFKYANAH